MRGHGIKCCTDSKRASGRDYKFIQKHSRGLNRVPARTYTFAYLNQLSYRYAITRKRERERQRERDRETERDRESDRKRETETENRKREKEYRVTY